MHSETVRVSTWPQLLDLSACRPWGDDVYARERDRHARDQIIEPDAQMGSGFSFALARKPRTERIWFEQLRCPMKSEISLCEPRRRWRILRKEGNLRLACSACLRVSIAKVKAIRVNNKVIKRAKWGKRTNVLFICYYLLFVLQILCLTYTGCFRNRDTVSQVMCDSTYKSKWKKKENNMCSYDGSFFTKNIVYQLYLNLTRRERKE